jgi:broad specificity phosphatase PhoE
MNSDALTTRVLLMRHAETAAPDLFHGAESDVGLGPSGFDQARRVGLAIRAGDWQGVESSVPIVSSSQRRARETAGEIRRAIGNSALAEPPTWEALHERLMGPMSGMPKGKGWAIYEETKARWMTGELDFTHPGGESFAAIRDRVVPVLADVARTYAGSTIVVVGHGIAIRAFLISAIPGLSPADFDRISLRFVTPHDLIWDGTAWRANRIAWESETFRP